MAAPCAALLTAAPACAQDGGDAETADPVSVDASIGVMSDYRFRGLSQTNREPSFQASVEIGTEAGWRAGAWTSNVTNMGGSNMELDLYGAYSGAIGPLDYTMTAVVYLYPGASGVNYGEFVLEVGHDIGPARLSGFVGYTPDQKNLQSDNLYLAIGAGVAIPETEVTLRTKLELEDGFYDRKISWEVGADYVRGPLTFSLAYVDTDYSGEDEAGSSGRAAILAGVLFSF